MKNALDTIGAFLGETARPIGFLATAWAGAIATIIVATKLTGDAASAAIFIGAVNAGTAALYTAKAWENSQSGKHTATVEVAKAASTTETK